MFQGESHLLNVYGSGILWISKPCVLHTLYSSALLPDKEAKNMGIYWQYNLSQLGLGGGGGRAKLAIQDDQAVKFV